jgi:hypothetical protein
MSLESVSLRVKNHGPVANELVEARRALARKLLQPDHWPTPKWYGEKPLAPKWYRKKKPRKIRTKGTTYFMNCELNMSISKLTFGRSWIITRQRQML